MEPINFTKLPGVTQVEELPEGAQVFIEYGGQVYRVPGAKVGGSGLPEGSSPNQYLITDSEGVAGWAERLAWKEENETVVADATDFLMYYDMYREGANGAAQNISGVKLSAGMELYVELSAVIGDEQFSFSGKTTVNEYDLVYLDNGKYKIENHENTYLLLTVVGTAETSSGTASLKVTRIDTETHPISDDLIPDTIARTSDIPEVVQSDMAVNDPDDPAYVKNRTHWADMVDTEIFKIEDFGGWYDGGIWATGAVNVNDINSDVLCAIAFYGTINGNAVNTEVQTVYDAYDSRATFILGGDNEFKLTCDSGEYLLACESVSEISGTFVLKARLPEYHKLPVYFGGVPEYTGDDEHKALSVDGDGNVVWRQNVLVFKVYDLDVAPSVETNNMSYYDATRGICGRIPISVVECFEETDGEGGQFYHMRPMSAVYNEGDDIITFTAENHTIVWGGEESDEPGLRISIS